MTYNNDNYSSLSIDAFNDALEKFKQVKRKYNPSVYTDVLPPPEYEGEKIESPSSLRYYTAVLLDGYLQWEPSTTLEEYIAFRKIIENK